MNIIEIMKRWPTQEAAIAHLEQVRWGGRPVCPYCNSEKTCVHASKDKKLPRWQCQDCSRAFSVTVGTIFHHSHLPLQTWFLAIAIMLNAKKGVSNAQLARDLDLPYKTAWSLAQRIRVAMATDPEQSRLFHGIVEMDETYIGGKPRKGNNASERKSSRRGRGTNKLAVVGIVERHGRAFAKAFDGVPLTFANLSKFAKDHVDVRGALIMTDEHSGYGKFGSFVQHAAVNHKKAYAVGDTHTNTIEGFWASVKRSWYGQHHHYSRKFADLYVSETAYKYSNRSNPGVFADLVRHMVRAPA